MQKNKRKTDSRNLTLQSVHRVAADKILKAWEKCKPREIERKLRGISEVDRWKMNEGRQMCHYQSIPLLVKLGDCAIPYFKMWRHLVVGMRLISGGGVDPVQPDAVDLSRTCMESFFVAFRDHFGVDACTNMVHISIHVPDDVQHVGVHVEAIDAFPFENCMPQILKVRIFFNCSAAPPAIDIYNYINYYYFRCSVVARTP
jgi:hypothetical protein